MEGENILFSFRGLVTVTLMDTVLLVLEQKLDVLNESSKTKKKVFNVIVECLQNLFHHIDGDEASINKAQIEANSACFIVAKKDNHYSVQTGNYIDQSCVEVLKRQLDTINKMDKEALKEYYKVTLSNSCFSQKGTAGLGMIDMARKSGNKLEYRFFPINDSKAFFCLTIKIE
jgi:hypothetical protein